MVSKREFDEEMAKQKARSKADANTESSDMVIVREDDVEEFVGYDHLKTTVEITKYRLVKVKNKKQVHLVFNITPFYAESGGQIGDTGYIESADGEKINILNTFKENNLTIHLCEKLPTNINDSFQAYVNAERRKKIANNHTATHLLHKALRSVLGTHVEQKGSLVNEDYLRFDFSHFKKMDDEEIIAVEREVNKMIRANYSQELYKDIPLSEATSLGAMSLFGEKYGDLVRAIKFGESIELCGGTHVNATGQIGFFVIRHETSVASGIRRIEALTAAAAEEHYHSYDHIIKSLKNTLKNQKDLVNGVQNLLEQNRELQKSLNNAGNKIVSNLKKVLEAKCQSINGVNLISERVDLSTDNAKNLIFSLSKSVKNALIVLALVNNNKPMLMVSVADELIKDKGLHAGNIIRSLAKEIQGGGGGQPHFATAGGKNQDGIEKALAMAKEFIN